MCEDVVINIIDDPQPVTINICDQELIEARIYEAENNKVLPVSETETFTLVVSVHKGKGIRCDSATGMTCNIPLNDSEAFEIGDTITIEQIGEGVVTAVPVAGVTLNGATKTGGQWKFIQLWKVGTNEWDAIGGV